jgi:hypothetical protein
MPRQRSENRLEWLRQQALALDAQIKAETVKERAKRDAEDQRRWLIAGAAALELMAAEPDSAFAATMLSLIDQRARSVADRALFNLAPLPKEGNGALT